MYMCYGPVVPDGYGCSYNPQKNEIVFCISSFNDCDSTSSERFKVALEEALSTMGSMCTTLNIRRSSSVECLNRDGNKPRSMRRDSYDYVRSNSQCETLHRDLQQIRRRTFQRAQTQETIQD